jgi:LmbE family N-acetylglucosaminyl deacetylase
MAPEWPSRCIGPAWEPDISFDIGTAMEAKVAACLCYEDEIRPYPHPRSEQAIRQQKLEWFKVIQ